MIAGKDVKRGVTTTVVTVVPINATARPVPLARVFVVDSVFCIDCHHSCSTTHKDKNYTHYVVPGTYIPGMYIIFATPFL